MYIGITLSVCPSVFPGEHPRVSPILGAYSVKIPLVAPYLVGLGPVFVGLGASRYGDFNMEVAIKPKC